ERAKLLEFYERVSGVWMYASFIQLGGVAQDLPVGLCIDINSFTQQFASRIDELEEMSTGNGIWKQRLVDMGTVTSSKGLGIQWCNVKRFWKNQLTSPFFIDLGEKEPSTSWEARHQADAR
ncbi:NADH dehydrogenase, partial [Datura stramonium]|nr:NADH dehydrogenase [ubiquinone] iron-sulfur protein 2 [Datura stramonium]